MIAVAGYNVREIISQDEHITICRGHREKDQKPVILKVLNKEYPKPEEISRLRFEYEILKELDIKGTPDPVSLEKYKKGLVLVMEDVGGKSVKTWIEDQKITEADFLPISIQITEILGEIHQRNIIHKDIKPSNLIVNHEAGYVGFIDFGIASHLSRETQKIVTPDVLEGTLAYISPEQTGRMNRSVDYRSDFYSLGVSFYEMLRGELPFSSEDPMELVHCHIAKTPDPPHVKDKTIPKVISDIVMKLMSKNAEDRYQSAYGLKADLETCLRQWQEKGKIEPFEIARNDISEKFQISQKLYGREEEIETLMTCFDQVSGGKAEMILVSGYSGIGKSSLVEEIHKPVARQRGYFISGKFGQFKRNIPLSSLIQAFQELIRQLLTESEDKVSEWKNSLLDALGGMGQVIIDVIPEVELIIGKQPPVLELDGTDAQNRFRDVFENFFSVFTTAAHPLVLFLDDLQWADQASLRFIRMLMTRKKGRYLLIVGAYRDNEVNPSHPLMITLEEIRKEKPFSTILLKPLDISNTNQLISDSLHTSSENTVPLSELLQQKTHGNPFFISQFLTSLYENDLLNFDIRARKWTWDTSHIEGMGFADNVVELMASKIRKLSETTQEFLKLASCLGTKFDLNTLAMISNSSHQNTALGLWEAIQEGVVVPLDDGYRYYHESHDADEYAPDPGTVTYRMLHDRIHEAVYAQIPDTRKKEVHLRIGRILLENISKAELEEHIFGLVNHLNMAADLLKSQEEKDELARLNLVAGKKAMASTAHSVALGYLSRGISLMADDAWDVHYVAMFQLHRERTECEFLCGNMDKSEEVFAITLEHAKTKMDMGNIYELMMGVYLTTGKWPEGMKLGQECLQRFDIELPDDPERLQTALDEEYRKIDENLAGQKI
ncbi:MAG: hypothetical protein B6245_18120, partial [Desulfobacteraceae bacterium 4572_88]